MCENKKTKKSVREVLPYIILMGGCVVALASVWYHAGYADATAKLGEEWAELFKADPELKTHVWNTLGKVNGCTNT